MPIAFNWPIANWNAVSHGHICSKTEYDFYLFLHLQPQTFPGWEAYQFANSIAVVYLVYNMEENEITIKKKKEKKWLCVY